MLAGAVRDHTGCKGALGCYRSGTSNRLETRASAREGTLHAVIEIATHTLTDALATYGYWAIFVLIAIESAGIPVPGETMLLAASVYAGTTHQLHLALIVVAAAAGAIVGDNVGFVLGREGGERLLRRYGHLVRLNERRLKVGRYLFLRHGGKVVFWGRFVAVLRMWAAFLAGAHRMPWTRFLVYNAAGGAVWATLYGVGGYMLGSDVLDRGGPVRILTLGLALVVGIAAPLMLHRYEARLVAEAERAFPSTLDPDTPPAVTVAA